MSPFAYNESIVLELFPSSKDEIIKKLLKVKMPVLKIWFDGRNFTLKLIYRATRDGFDAAKFHSLVDN